MKAGEKSMIYLDNNATTRVHPEVLESMLPFLTEYYANPSSGYQFARPVKRAVDEAREQVAALLNASPDEIIFTSGGTEADNTAIASAVNALPGRKHLVTSRVEHPAVLQFMDRLEADEGYTSSRLGVSSLGELDLEQLDRAIDPDKTALVSLMWANNETGTLFPIAEAAALAQAKGVFFHTDAVQAVGKTPIDVKASGVHFLALSAHKFHGPKGVGALYVNPHVRLTPRVLGGAQERNRRGGTENVAGIVGLGKAADLMRQKLERGDHARLACLRDRFEAQLQKQLEGVHVNGHPEHRLVNTANLAFDGLEAAGLLIMLDEEQICASAGSACHTGALHPSETLAAMGFSRERALGTVRFSLSGFTTEEEIDRAVASIVKNVRKLRGLRPQSRVVMASAPPSIDHG